MGGYAAGTAGGKGGFGRVGADDVRSFVCNSEWNRHQRQDFRPEPVGPLSMSFVIPGVNDVSGRTEEEASRELLQELRDATKTPEQDILARADMALFRDSEQGRPRCV